MTYPFLIRCPPPEDVVAVDTPGVSWLTVQARFFLPARSSSGVSRRALGLAVFLLTGFKPGSDGTDLTGEVLLGKEPAADHDVSKCEELTFRIRNFAVHCLKLILGVTPLE